MMAFSTRSCRSGLDTLLAALALLAVLLAGPVHAADPEIRYAEIVLREDGYVVKADIQLELNPRLVEAVNRGVALHFAAEFSIGQSRWYWLDESIAERRLDYRLSYHPITRSYRISIGNLPRSFDTIEEAVRSMQRIRNWQIVPTDRLETGVSYNAALRFLHDTSQLPKPFQVTIDGTVICDGEFDISPLCIETGEPVRSGDIKSYYTKLFAPSEQRQTLFRFLHYLHQSIFVTGFVMGILLRLGNERVPFLFGIPVGIPFFRYLGLMILVLRRIPFFHIIFRRSKEGSRQRVRRRAIPTLILAPNLVVCLWALPAAFRANVFIGIAATVVAMIIPTITLHYGWRTLRHSRWSGTISYSRSLARIAFCARTIRPQQRCLMRYLILLLLCVMACIAYIQRAAVSVPADTIARDLKLADLALNMGIIQSIWYRVKDRIAIVYAEGEIRDFVDEEGVVGGDKYARILRRIKNDDRIKAVVSGSTHRAEVF